MKGIVKNYITPRGFGFIEGEGKKSYFFHITDTNLDTRFQYQLDGVEVEFDPVETQLEHVIRTAAKNVRILAEIEYSNDTMKEYTELGE